MHQMRQIHGARAVDDWYKHERICEMQNLNITTLHSPFAQ